MNPEESHCLEVCIQEAAIFYRNTPKSELKPLESLDKTLREQIIQQDSPNTAVFFCQVSGTERGRK